MTRRAFAALGPAALVAGLCPIQAATVSEAGRSGLLQPRHPLLTADGADAFTTLMSYDPQTDPDAPYFRSKMRRAARIAPFAATQAHPRLNPQPGVASLSDCYGPLATEGGDETFRTRYGASPPGLVQVPRIFCYHDIVVGWSGTGMIPNPALVDAAHRNGALGLGTIFQPDRRLYDSSIVPIPEVAAHLVMLAAYFGFDGYFVNFEGWDYQSHARVQSLIAAMRDAAQAKNLADFHIQFYDGSTRMEGLMPLRDGRTGASYATSVMLDQGWSTYSGPGGCCSGRPRIPQDVQDYCLGHGFDPLATAYFGFQLYPGPGYFAKAAPAVIHPNDGAYAHGSLQIYGVEDGLRILLRAQPKWTRALGDMDGPHAGRQALARLERMFFSGASQNPASANQPGDDSANSRGGRSYSDYHAAAPKPSDQTNLPITYGVANFIVERSVIQDFPFLTHFNTGEGDRFFVDGEPVSKTPWFNLGIQDILPTWQWRLEPMARPSDSPAPAADRLCVDYDFTTAFDGGTSLRISGLLDPAGATRLWLYKTRLEIDAAARNGVVHLVVKGAPAAIACLQLGLIFADAPAAPVWTPLADRKNVSVASLANGWSRFAFGLAPYQGRTIAAILFGIALPNGQGAPIAMDVNIGQVYVGALPLSNPASAPTGLVVQGHTVVPNTGLLQARLRWDPDDHAAYHDIFAADKDAKSWTWQGRIIGDAYYVCDAPVGTDGTTLLLVRSVPRVDPLTPSKPASVRVDAGVR